MFFLVHRGKSFAARRQHQRIEEPVRAWMGRCGASLLCLLVNFSRKERRLTLVGTPTEFWALHLGFYVQYANCLESLFHQTRDLICLAFHCVPRTHGRHSKNICQGQQPEDPWDSSLPLHLGESKACSHCRWSREPVSFSGVVTPGNPLKAQQLQDVQS